MQDEHSLLRPFSLVVLKQSSQAVGAKLLSGFTCQLVPSATLLPRASLGPGWQRGTLLLRWGSYLMYLQPSRFFRITSTVTPFSKPISSLLWLV